MSSKTEALELASLLTPAEVAVLLKLTPRSIVRMARLRQIPSIRLSPHCLRFRRPDVDAWLDRHSAARMPSGGKA